MKKLLLAGFLLVASMVYQEAIAQNYQPFRKGLTYHFISQDSVYSMRIDSAKVVAGDSVFVFNQTVKRDNSNCLYCYLIQKNNQFGNKVIKKQNGDFIFRTSQGQDFLLKTKTPLNQTWSFNTAANITATLTGKSLEPVQSYSDSVFTYALSNGAQIKLSKNYGFLKAPNFTTYSDPAFKPKTLAFYALPEKGLGSQLSDPFRIYDFVVGNKFMYYLKTFDTFPFSTGPCTEEWKQYEVLSKRISANNDTIYYSLKSDRLQKGYGSPSAPSGMCQTPTGSTIYPSQTYTWYVTRNSPEKLLTLSNSYYYPITNNYNQSVTKGIFKNQQFNSREQLTYVSGLNFYTAPNGFAPPVDGGSLLNYGVGLGMTYESSMYSTETLIAYVKGSETYGKWQSLSQILATKKELETKLLVKAYPNPFTSELTLALGETSGNVQLTILNTLGQTVWQKETPATANSEINIAMPKLAKGLYFLQASQNGKTYTTRLVKE